MAVVDVLRKVDSSGEVSLDDRYRAFANKTVTWTATVDDPANDTETTVENSVLVVQPGNAHPDSVYYRCKRRTVRKVSPVLYEITAIYETPQFDPGVSGTGSPNPLTVPALITFDTYSSDELIDEDTNGNAIATANGELFQGVTRQVSDLQITITKNFASFTPSAFYTYIDSVNSDVFIGFPAGTVRCAGISAREIVQDDWRYWEVTVVFLARKPYRTSNARAWWVRVRHEGFYVRKVDPFGNLPDGRERATDDQDPPQPVVQPVFLAENGDKLQMGSNPFWKEFQVYESRAFAPMGLV